ncbi:hypothetical protein [Pseudocolwellia sp. HL-MZ7]|uniref:hypothetical protein n=1 Tax=Pseudocolwellia sp. HL-MZ7 TaxID=3400627 RepID=UPI003CFB5BFA
MQEANQKKSIFQKFLGEYRWGRNFLWVISILCLFDAIWVTAGTGELIRDGAFHSSLLFGIAGYLSELRYRFIPESRNN